MPKERPIDMLRRMNPGVDIPTGQELSDRIKIIQSEKNKGQGKMIKCPGCDLMLPEDDLQAQVEHMDEFHPDIVAKRLEEVDRL